MEQFDNSQIRDKQQRIVWHEDVLTPDVPLDEITILQQGEISIEKETK